MTNDPMRYALHLELLEQDGVRDDDHAIELLRSEFALANNAALFDAITDADIELGAVTRRRGADGVARYRIELFVREREEGLDDRRAVALLLRALTDALNASYFLRLCSDVRTMRLVSRTRVAEPVPSAA